MNSLKRLAVPTDSRRCRRFVSQGEDMTALGGRTLMALRAGRSQRAQWKVKPGARRIRCEPMVSEPGQQSGKEIDVNVSVLRLCEKWFPCGSLLHSGPAQGVLEAGRLGV